MVVLSASALVVAYFFRLMTPNQSPPSTIIFSNFDGSETTFSNVQYVGTIGTIPEKLGVAAVNYSTIDTTEKERQLSELFNLQPNPEVEGYWVGNEYFMTSTDTVIPAYLITNNEVLIEETEFSLQRAVEIGSAYAEQITGQKLDFITNSEIYYYANAPEFMPASQTSAHLIELQFGYILNNYSLLPEIEQAPPVTIYLDANYKLSRLLYAGYQIEVISQNMQKTIPISQAIENIERDRGAIITRNYEGFTPLSLRKIESAVFNNYFIEYRVDPTTNTAVPYYRFTGELTTDEEQVFDAEVITPAIQTDFGI